MRKHTSALSLMKSQTAMLQRWKTDAVTAYSYVAVEALRDARKLTSGTVSAQAMRRMGHPFGRSFRGLKGKSRARLAPLPINRQTGELNRLFVLDGSRKGGKFTYGLKNRSPYAKFILSDSGTKTMLGRGFKKELHRRHRARTAAFLRYYRGKQRS